MLLLPPTVALIVVGSWLGFQRRDIDTLEKANGLLREQLATARNARLDGESPTSKAVQASKEAKGKEVLNWKKIAGQLAEMQRSGGMVDMRTWVRTQQRIQDMTKDELVVALEEIAALGLPADSRRMLEQMLLGSLCKKDPELALTRFVGQVQERQGGMQWQLAHALREWAQKDAAKAGAWFDQQIAAGIFDSKSLDGRSQARVSFEASMIGVLIGSDIAAAGRRLAALPEDQRADVIRQTHPKEESQAAMAKLVREQVPADEQGRIFGSQASSLVYQGGYSKVSEYLDRIEATPAERVVCAEQAATSKFSSNDKPVTREDLDAMRQWVGSQAPEATDRVTGKILDRATHGAGKMDFAAAGELAVQYGEASGTDEVLGTFLESSSATSNKEQARELAARITDDERRAKILKRLK